MGRFLLFFPLLLSLAACQRVAPPPPAVTAVPVLTPVTFPVEEPASNVAVKPDMADEFVDVATLDPTIRLDIRYATTNNFTKAQIYDCPQCLLRPLAAAAIVKVHKNLQKKGLGLKMFDCYRPRPYQQRLWDKVPNPDYVTPPAKGSMHSRGAATDLTIVDAKGNELDMGTEFDFFGPKAHFDHTDLPQKVLKNRRLLRRVMEEAGFKGIRTEWWHFSYQGKDYALSDYVWPCK
jgi:zinc D-Ala-D-Ala dipeptidase